MHKAYYREQRTMLRWNDDSIVGYLNEEQVKDYQPEAVEGEEAEKYDAYAYTGDLLDGGTVMPCKDPTSYPQVANAIIRSKYSESDELAIQRHKLNGEYDEDSTEYDEYNAWCESAKTTAKAWVKAYTAA